MSQDLHQWIASFRSWCRVRGLSPRYVTKEACRNSRLIERMARSADKHARDQHRLEAWMRDWDDARGYRSIAEAVPDQESKTAAE
jgi:hypothetical protein